MMSSRNKIKWLLCLTLIIAAPAPEANAQVGRIVKSTVKNIGKWFSKKGVKEGAEEAVEQSSKTISKEMAQRVIVKNASPLVMNSTSRVSRNALRDVTATNIRRTLTRQVGKDISESALKSTGKEFAQKIGKTASKEAQEYFAKRLGSESAQEAYELSAKKSLKEVGEKNLTRKTVARAAARSYGDKALAALDDMPSIRKQIKALQKKSPSYFTTDKLYVEHVGNTRIVGFEGTSTKIEIAPNGIIKAQGGSTMKNGPMNEFLNMPEPNTRYETEGGLLNYKTDKMGRTTYVESHSSQLAKSSMPRNDLSADNKTQYVKEYCNRVGRNPNGYDSGHIQSHATGGLNERINLLPMKAKNNRGGPWARLEKQERDAIAAGKDVKRRTYITYRNAGSYTIKVELEIDGKVITKVFNDLF